MAGYFALCEEIVAFRNHAKECLNKEKPIRHKKYHDLHYNCTADRGAASKNKNSVVFRIKRTYSCRDMVVSNDYGREPIMFPGKIIQVRDRHLVRYKVKNKAVLDHLYRFLWLYGFCDHVTDARDKAREYWNVHLKEERIRLMSRYDVIEETLWTDMLPRLTYVVTDLDKEATRVPRSPLQKE